MVWLCMYARIPSDSGFAADAALLDAPVGREMVDGVNAMRVDPNLPAKGIRFAAVAPARAIEDEPPDSGQEQYRCDSGAGAATNTCSSHNIRCSRFMFGLSESVGKAVRSVWRPR